MTVRTACGCQAFTGARAPSCSRPPSAMSTAGRPQVRSCTAGLTLSQRRVAQLGLRFDEIHSDLLGLNACHGPAAPRVQDPPEVQLRIAVRGEDRSSVERFTREIAPLVLAGPPTATGFGEGRPPVREVVAYWPALLPREAIQTRVEVFE